MQKGGNPSKITEQSKTVASIRETPVLYAFGSPNPDSLP